MKQSRGVQSLILCFSLAACSHSVGPGNETSVAYTAYTGYSYGGPRPASDTTLSFQTTLFFQTTDERSFDSLFFFIAGFDSGPTIPLSDLSTKKVVSIVKYGNNYYSLQMTKITLLGTALKVYYTSTLESANMTWVAGIPLIATLDAKYQKIEFIENGKQVGELIPSTLRPISILRRAA